MNGFIGQDNKINYQYTTKILELGRQPIETIDQYRQWVYQWKKLHAELVAAIFEFRRLKREAKSGTIEKNQFHLRKKSLGTYARTMYELRVDRKADCKANKYKQAEVV